MTALDAMQVLRLRWDTLAERCGVDDTDGAVFGRLVAGYTQTHRRYHTLRHLTHTLDRVHALFGRADAHAMRVSGRGLDLRPAELAMWFHDVVYDVDRHDNEDRSAELAERWLPAAGAAMTLAAETGRLVRLTAGHDPAEADAAGLLVCDADLAILGEDADRYAGYVAGVRTEYRRVDDEAWRRGRGRVLDGLLARPALYRLDGQQSREQRARANLAAELAQLRAGSA